jgi:formiminotetrahydrofolate cyclodeaminase
VPAGGSAAAAALAMAAGLVEKAARLSASQWIGAANVRKRAAVLRRAATRLVDADADAYMAYVKTLRAAKGLHTVDRARIVGPASARIIEVPLAIVRAASEVAQLGVDLALHGNPNLRSDATVATHLAAAAAQSGTATLTANVKSSSDARLVEARGLARAAKDAAENLRRTSAGGTSRPRRLPR